MVIEINSLIGNRFKVTLKVLSTPLLMVQRFQILVSDCGWLCNQSLFPLDHLPCWRWLEGHSRPDYHQSDVELLLSNLHVFPNMVSANSLSVPDISCSPPPTLVYQTRPSLLTPILECCTCYKLWSEGSGLVWKTFYF